MMFLSLLWVGRKKREEKNKNSNFVREAILPKQTVYFTRS